VNPKIIEQGKYTRFKPGMSVNPAGRPRRKPIRDLIVAVLDIPLSPEALKLVRPALRALCLKGVTYGDLLAISIVIRCLDKADVASLREILACEKSVAKIRESDQNGVPWKDYESKDR